MITRTFAELARDLRQRRAAVVGDSPPVLMLGAGASVESGIGAMDDLFRFVDCKDFSEFTEYIKGFTPQERYRLLSGFLQSQAPSDVTPGYRALATLCAEGYFDLILTLNLDPLLDDALAGARLWRRDYLIVVNGVIQMNWLKILVSAASPRVKVIKLHGDLFHRCMAWTVEEMDEMVGQVNQELVAALRGRDLLVVGTSLRDARIKELVEQSDGSVWYTHPTKVPDFLADNPRLRAVLGPECNFESIFFNLAKELVGSPAMPGTRTPPTVRGVAREQLPGLAAAPGAQTMDDLMASIVGLAAEADGPSIMTGFVLAEPRLIVTDGLDQNVNQFDPAHVTVVTSIGQRMTSRFVGRDKSFVFGPMLVEAPRDLKVGGLQVNPGRLKRNMDVRIGVAAGERVGISSGVIKHPSAQQIQIQPIGVVDKLVAVESVVAPGASGAPVVDETLAVRGFIVAGGVERPPAFMYPAEFWMPNLLTQAKRRSAKARPAGTPRKRGR